MQVSVLDSCKNKIKNLNIGSDTDARPPQRQPSPPPSPLHFSLHELSGSLAFQRLMRLQMDPAPLLSSAGEPLSSTSAAAAVAQMKEKRKSSQQQ